MKKIFVCIVWLLMLSTPYLVAQTAQVTKMEYWIDVQYDKRVTQASNGMVSAEIDCAQLSPGIHSIAYRFCDDKGRWSAPLLHYFMRPVAPVAHNRVTGYEYWFDTDYAGRMKGEFSDSLLSLSLDLPQLCAGVHSIALRTCDEQGHWSAPLLSYFMRPALPIATDNRTVSCEYWLDGKYDNRTTSPVTDDSISFTLDATTLCKGVHLMSYRAQDSQGVWSAPVNHYFAVIEPDKSNNGIVAYEYFFNHGHAVHVDVTPQNPFTLQDLMIDITGVQPNEIAAKYRFDVASLTAYTNDSVTFGLRCIDKLGKSAPAVLSSKFFMEVPVVLNPKAMGDMDTCTFTPPESGEMASFVATVKAGDTLRWSTQGTYTLDFYNELGSKLTPTVSKDGLKQPLYTLTAGKEGKVYALAHHSAAGVYKNLVLSLEQNSLDKVDVIRGEDDTFAIHAHTLVVISQEGGRLNLFDLSGRTLLTQEIESGKHEFVVRPGVYMVKMGNGGAKKIMIP